MSLLRFVLLSAIVGFLVIFALSNWGVSVSLVFLGIPSPAFPLPVWILGAIAFGVATTLVITALFGLARFTARRSERKSVRQAPTQTNSYAYAETPRESTPRSVNDTADDWFGDDGDDWTTEPKDRPKQDFETRQEPTSGKRSGSTYSYTYREPPEPKKPDVVDAEYRVIRPPVRKLDEDEG
ncbi:MAG: LapA family protein [Plectolyngbya sp. WJT66-NPBG17]|jgi:uncharacterized integral membrane protein|nr:LapA family protein [Plectolyngbya sp. WJT66-NPBG17]MBW4525687.1 LapA family protein [Phormidium tanganyikae FI6-MK23]